MEGLFCFSNVRNELHAAGVQLEAAFEIFYYVGNAFININVNIWRKGGINMDGRQCLTPYSSPRSDKCPLPATGKMSTFTSSKTSYFRTSHCSYFNTSTLLDATMLENKARYSLCINVTLLKMQNLRRQTGNKQPQTQVRHKWTSEWHCRQANIVVCVNMGRIQTNDKVIEHFRLLHASFMCRSVSSVVSLPLGIS